MPAPQIILGLSGGVDSTAAALLLAEQGYQVTGVHFIFGQESLEKSKEIAKKLRIKLLLADTRDLFKQIVVQPFLAEYQKGRTPNPCVFCNHIFKFRVLQNFAKELKIEQIATGHYVRQVGQKLFRACDKKKDQSFFLSRLTAKDLEKTIFPLGDYLKRVLQKKVQKAGFSFDGESQDLCFVNGEISDFLKENLPVDFQKEGDLMYHNEVLGRHQGLFNFTIGQRAKVSGQKEPLFVQKLDMKKNVVQLALDKDLFSQEMFLDNCSWITKKAQGAVEVQIRHQAPAQKADIKTSGQKAYVYFQDPVRAISPGQSVAVYQGDELLGGGVIED